MVWILVIFHACNYDPNNQLGLLFMQWQVMNIFKYINYKHYT